MLRNVCISAIDGQTGFLIAELLLSNQTFSSKIDSICGTHSAPHVRKVQGAPEN